MKQLAALLLSLVCALGAFALVGCQPESGEALSGTLTVVIDDKAETKLVYAVNLAEAELTTASKGDDVLEYLAATTSFYYEGKNSAYGLYLTAMGTYDAETYTYQPVLQEDMLAGKYCYVYTSVTKDQDTSEYKSEVTYEGMTLVNSALGISSMTVEPDAVLYFTYY